MTSETTRHVQEFYSTKSSTTMSSFLSKETSRLFSKDALDGCVENGHQIRNKLYETNSELKMIKHQEYSSSSSSSSTSNGTVEKKSFIQQRVERLYGPGALAQGFFVSKRQMNRLSESDETKPPVNESSEIFQQHDVVDDLEPMVMKQSTSSPTLPVLRHLRPEFRAQLPVITMRKSSGGVEVSPSMQKSSTVPKLNDSNRRNGESVEEKGKKAMVPVVLKEELGEKDGHYFLKILEEQTKRLLGLADKTERYLETAPDLSEDIIGKIRSASGKARLLVSQKMQQFRGLCTNNINQSIGEAFPTTNADIQGFWDMVMLQVDQVDALFEEIELLRKNNWKEVPKVENKVNGSNKTKKTVVRVRPQTAGNEEARKAREAQRKQLIELRRKALKGQQKKPTESIEIFVPETS